MLVCPMAEAVRFELTVPCGTLVFKTSALSQTRPHFRYLYFLAVRPGFEPGVRLAAYERLAIFWFKPLTHLTLILVRSDGIEPPA